MLFGHRLTFSKHQHWQDAKWEPSSLPHHHSGQLNFRGIQLGKVGHPIWATTEVTQADHIIIFTTVHVPIFPHFHPLPTVLLSLPFIPHCLHLVGSVVEQELVKGFCL